MSKLNKHILGFVLLGMIGMTIIDRDLIASLLGFAAVLWMGSAFNLKYRADKLKAEIMELKIRKDK